MVVDLGCACGVLAEAGPAVRACPGDGAADGGSSVLALATPLAPAAARQAAIMIPAARATRAGLCQTAAFRIVISPHSFRRPTLMAGNNSAASHRRFSRSIAGEFPRRCRTLPRR